MAWGFCKDCKWWQVEPSSSGGDHAQGQCIEEKLQPFNLRVNGSGGCNRYMAGKPARAQGSGDAPPTAAPSR